MPTEIPVQDQLKLLKHYLGRFFMKVDESEKASFTELAPKKQSFYILGKQITLKKFGCHFLLRFGRLDHKFVYTYELVDKFLGNTEEEGETFYDTHTPVLFVYHMSGTMENKQLENMVNHLVGQRNIERKITILMVETPMVKVEANCRELQIPIIHLDKGRSKPGSDTDI